MFRAKSSEEAGQVRGGFLEEVALEIGLERWGGF